MKTFLATLGVVCAVLVGTQTAHAQSAPSADFLCAAEASKKGLFGGHPDRRAYIATCVATRNAAKPTAPKPVAPTGPSAKPVAPPSAPPQRPRALIETAEQRRAKIVFNCGVAASRKGLNGFNPARAAFIDDCVRRSPPVKE